MDVQKYIYTAAKLRKKNETAKFFRHFLQKL